MASVAAPLVSLPRPKPLASVLKALAKVAPLKLAAKWDNVGLLLDSTRDSFPSPFVVFLTNDLTEKVVDEALARGTHLIVTYHPTPFRGMKRVVREDPVGRVVLKCLANGVAVYSTHTACDCVPGGVNDWLVKGLGDGSIVPAQPDEGGTGIEGAGFGRVMTLASPTTLAEIIARCKSHLSLPHVRVGIAMNELAESKADADSVSTAAANVVVNTVAVCAGSGASVLGGVDADVWVTGEMSHHEVLKANADGVSVILTDHSNTERGFLPVMKAQLQAAIGEVARDVVETVEIHITELDADPLVVV